MKKKKINKFYKRKINFQKKKLIYKKKIINFIKNNLTIIKIFFFLNFFLSSCINITF